MSRTGPGWWRGCSTWSTFCHHSFFFPRKGPAEQGAAGRDAFEIPTPLEGFAVAQQIANAWLRYGH